MLLWLLNSSALQQISVLKKTNKKPANIFCLNLYYWLRLGWPAGLFVLLVSQNVSVIMEQILASDLSDS